MKIIANIASITDNSENTPIITYSNSVQTIIRTPNENGRKVYYKIICVHNCCCCDYDNFRSDYDCFNCCCELF